MISIGFTKRLLIWYWKVPFVLGATGDLGIDRRKSRDTGPDSIEDLGDCKQKTNSKEIETKEVKKNTCVVKIIKENLKLLTTQVQN